MASRPLPPLELLETQLLTLVQERLLEPRAGFGVDSSLYEAGLDSMAIMQLLVLLEEEFGVVLPDSDLTQHNLSTVRHLAVAVRARAIQPAHG